MKTATGLAHDGPPSGALATVVVGDHEELAELLQGPLHAGDGPLAVRALVAMTPVEADATPDDPDRVPVAAIREAIQHYAAGALLMTGSHGPRIMAVLGELAVSVGCRLLVPAPRIGSARLTSRVTRVQGVPVIEILPPTPASFPALAKRAIDLTVAGMALVVVAPILALLALGVRMDSHGSPFFGHERVGQGGRRFRCWKLRTMRTDAEQMLAEDSALRAAYEANDFKLPDDQDPRVTRVGYWLRRSSLDELPQLWNVLVGEMSLVGPRPLVANELAHYPGTVLELLSVRPGITGAWAVNGRHAVSYPQRAELELAYVRERSLRADLKILLGTVKAVVRPGAQ
jgi:lipopolysaccharide/colanic/teichoic acid biosynthesis glycosyltransferase